MASSSAADSVNFSALAKSQRKFAQAARPLVGHIPTIAITPVADGRTGAYEGNVAGTWKMVENVYDLIANGVKLPDGTEKRTRGVTGADLTALREFAQGEVKHQGAMAGIPLLFQRAELPPPAAAEVVAASALPPQQQLLPPLLFLCSRAPRPRNTRRTSAAGPLSAP